MYVFIMDVHQFISHCLITLDPCTMTARNFDGVVGTPNIRLKICSLIGKANCCVNQTLNEPLGGQYIRHYKTSIIMFKTDPRLSYYIKQSWIFKSFSGEPDRGEPNRSGSPLRLTPIWLATKMI